MQLSRIVTLYNQWHHLAWLQDDALFNPDTEFIFVDDGSSVPPPQDLLTQLRARGVRLHTLPRNRGRSGGRNAGAQLARGEWIEFIDGDDLPLPFLPDPGWREAEVVFFPFRVHVGDGPSSDGVPGVNPLVADPNAPGGHVDPRPVAVLWRTVTFHALGGFDSRFEPVEDLEIVLRARFHRRAFARQPKQSYNNEHRASTIKGLDTAAALLRVYERLPADEPLRPRLVEAQVENLMLLSTWHLLRNRRDGFLTRAALSLLWNIAKARFGARPTTHSHDR